MNILTYVIRLCLYVYLSSMFMIRLVISTFIKREKFMKIGHQHENAYPRSFSFMYRENEQQQCWKSCGFHLCTQAWLDFMNEIFFSFPLSPLFSPSLYLFISLISKIFSAVYCTIWLVGMFTLRGVDSVNTIKGKCIEL